MTRLQRSAIALLVVLGCAGGAGCQLKRPQVIPTRMIEPQLVDLEPLASARPGPTAADAIPVRLLETQARAHIGRSLLRQEADGELVQDAVWRWSSPPTRYLDSALRVAFASSPDVRLVDSGNATAIAVTLIAWHLESASSVHLVGAVELVMTSTDRTVHAQVIRGSEPVSSELPGNLAAAAGHLIQRLASDSLTQATHVRSVRRAVVQVELAGHPTVCRGV